MEEVGSEKGEGSWKNWDEGIGGVGKEDENLPCKHTNTTTTTEFPNVQINEHLSCIPLKHCIPLRDNTLQ